MRIINKIKEWNSLRKLVKASKKVYIINMAEVSTTLRKWVNSADEMIENQKETIGSLTKDDLNSMMEFMKNMNSDEFQKTTISSIIGKESN